MPDGDLKKLSRLELIDIIGEMQKRLEEAESETEKLRAEAKKRELRIASSGSIAEAALKVNGVFDAAQSAAEQYLQSFYKSSPEALEIVASAEKKGEEIIEDAKKRGRAILASAEKQARALVIKTKKYDAEKRHDAEEAAKEYLRLHEGLKAIFEEKKPDES